MKNFLRSDLPSLPSKSRQWEGAGEGGGGEAITSMDFIYLFF